jgi:hypothetical protein
MVDDNAERTEFAGRQSRCQSDDQGLYTVVFDAQVASPEILFNYYIELGSFL